jgi:hypothetical protein
MGTSSDPEAYLLAKREHYASDPTRHAAYFEDPSRAEYQRLRELWRPRLRSTTTDIADLWTRSLRRGDELFRRLLNQPETNLSLDSDLGHVPTWLGSDAFIGDFVIRALADRGVNLRREQEQLIAWIIHRSYNQSWIDEIGATVVLGGPTRSHDALLEGAYFTFDVGRFDMLLDHLGLGRAAAALTATQLLQVRTSLEWEMARPDLVARAGQRRGQLWRPDEAAAVKTARARQPRDPVERFRAVSESYTAAVHEIAKRRLIEEAEIEGKRKGARVEIHGGSFGDMQVGDRSGPTFVGGGSVTGGRLQLGGQSLDLLTAPASDVRRGIVELLGVTPPDHVVRELTAVENAIAEREDIVDAEVEHDIVEAFSGAREASVTEHLKVVSRRIGEASVVGAASGGLTAVVLHALRALGLA